MKNFNYKLGKDIPGIWVAPTLANQSSISSDDDRKNGVIPEPIIAKPNPVAPIYEGNKTFSGFNIEYRLYNATAMRKLNIIKP